MATIHIIDNFWADTTAFFGPSWLCPGTQSWTTETNIDGVFLENTFSLAFVRLSWDPRRKCLLKISTLNKCSWGHTCSKLKTGNGSLFQQRPFTISRHFFDSFGDSSGTDTGGLSCGSLDRTPSDHPWAPASWGHWHQPRVGSGQHRQNCRQPLSQQKAGGPKRENSSSLLRYAVISQGKWCQWALPHPL